MSRWHRVQIRRLFRIVNGGTPTSDSVNWGGPIAWATPVDLGRRHGQLIADTERTLTETGLRTGSAILPPGSLIVSTRAPIGYVSETTVPMAFNQGCRGLAPHAHQHVRYFRYALIALAAQLEAAGQGSTFIELSADQLAQQAVPSPPLPEQRAIADFLDTETARIDTLITKKRRMLQLLEDKRWRVLEETLASRNVDLPASVQPEALRGVRLPGGWRVMRLSTTLRQLTNGYVGPTRDILRDEGVRYVQGLHLKRGVIDFDRRPYFVDADWHETRPRTALSSGDVLIVQTGDIGQCAVVPEHFGEANCHALLIARVHAHIARPTYIAAYLQSRFGYHSLVRVATGALHPHLEFGIRDVPVIVPPLDIQDALVTEVQHRTATIDSTLRALEAQIDLLGEHRQALITAAVTGEVDVPGVAA